jgi:transcription elongation factor Elf1
MNAYLPTMRCPTCRSICSSVHIVDGKTIWTCGSCCYSFEPSSETRRTPIIVCASCADFTPHAFEGVEERSWINRSPAGESASSPNSPSKGSPATIFPIEVYACQICGARRMYGIASMGDFLAHRGKVIGGSPAGTTA